MVAIDRLGKMIEPGHLVLFHASEDLIFEVVSVGPVLNPSVQGGRAIQAVLRTEVPVIFQPAYPNRGMIVVGETQARAAATAAGNGKMDTVMPAVEEEPSGIVLTDPTPEPLSSGMPCGCDPAANWVCEQHRVSE